MTDHQRAHEQGIVKGFILPNRQGRYLEFFARPKRRADFTGQLAHFKNLNPAFVEKIPPSRQIAKILHAKGAPRNCWVISESKEMNARQMGLAEALREIVGRGIGTFLSCLPGELGYFEDEEGRFILHRSPKSP